MLTGFRSTYPEQILTAIQPLVAIRYMAALTGAEVVNHTCGGARLSEQLNPKTKLGARTQAALTQEHWDYVVLQEMSHGPVSSPERFLSSVERLCAIIRENGAVPVLYATWGYQRGSAALAAKNWDYDAMARGLSEAYRKAAENNHALLAESDGGFMNCPMRRTFMQPTVSIQTNRDRALRRRSSRR